MEKLLKVLMLEDNNTDALIIQRILKRNNMLCRFHIVMEREAYIKALEEFKPDIILSDNSMPTFTGSEALQIAKKDYKDIPFILVTGTVSEEFAAGIIKAGADDYLIKDRLTRLPGAMEAAMKQKQIEKENREATARLKESEVKYRNLVERITDAFVALDKEWRYTYANKKAAQILGRQQDYLISKHVWTEFPERLGTVLHKAYEKAMKTQRYIYIEEYFAPSCLWLEHHIYPSPAGLSVFFRDITDRKKAEQEINNRNEELHLLTAHLQTVREEERKRIGREIHDELGQQLTVIKMDTVWIDKNIPAETTAIKNKLQNIISLLDGSNLSIRRILNELRPAVLDRHGLFDAVKLLEKQFTANTGIPVTFKMNETEIKLPEAIATCIFRAYQEAFTNISRYAEATRVRTSFSIAKNIITIKISDNGKGFNTTSVESKKSFGLLGMKERVHSLGGSFKVESSPGKGTTITIRLSTAIPKTN